jgi:hypothetical protein
VVFTHSIRDENLLRKLTKSNINATNFGAFLKENVDSLDDRFKKSIKSWKSIPHFTDADFAYLTWEDLPDLLEVEYFNAIDMLNSLDKVFDHKTWSIDLNDPSKYYIPNFKFVNTKSIKDIRVIQVAFRLMFNIELVIIQNESYSFSKEDEDYLLSLFNLRKTETFNSTLYSSKYINKMLAFLIFNFKLRTNEEVKFSYKKFPNNLLVKNFTALLINKADSLLVLKKHVELLWRNSCGKIVKKAWSYRSSGEKIFNYEEVLRLFDIKFLKKFKEEFKFQPITRKLDNFFINVMKTSNKEDYISNWNAEAKLLIESSYFEFYKVRVTKYRKYRKIFDNEVVPKGKVKERVIKRIQTTYNDIEFNDSINQFFFEFKDKLSKSQVNEMLSTLSIDKNNIIVNSIPEFLYREENKLLLIKWLNASSQKDIKLLINAFKPKLSKESVKDFFEEK